MRGYQLRNKVRDGHGTGPENPNRSHGTRVPSRLLGTVPKLGIRLSKRFLSRDCLSDICSSPKRSKRISPNSRPKSRDLCPGQKSHGIPVPSLNKVHQKRKIENYFNWIKAYNQTWCIEQGCPIHPITVPRYVSYLCSLLSIIIIIKKRKFRKKFSARIYWSREIHFQL